MEFELHKHDNYAVIKITVEKLDSVVSPVLKSELVVLNNEGVKNIVLDLSAARYCDSSGLSSILVGNRLCKNAGGKFVLSGLQDAVKKLIFISQLDSILNITTTVEESLEKLR
jgi:anti-sigma B factor antagonist